MKSDIDYYTLGANDESAQIILREDETKGITYLTTISNGIAEDNLGNLPEE